MQEEKKGAAESAPAKTTEVRSLIRDVIQEFAEVERSKAEPAYKAELAEERKRRERLEQRLNELVEENQKSRARAEEIEREAAIRAELQRLGVTKVDLAFRAVKDEIFRSEDGRLLARSPQGEAAVRDYLEEFVQQNPELLPARITGGSGAGAGQRNAGTPGGGIDLDKIRPGMSAEDLDRARLEIARIASQSLRGI